MTIAPWPVIGVRAGLVAGGIVLWLWPSRSERAAMLLRGRF
jgi:hypothetical protein